MTTRRSGAMRFLMATVPLLAATTLAPNARAQSSAPAVHEESQPRSGLLIGGVTTFGVSYAAAVTLFAFDHRRDEGTTMPAVHLGPGPSLLIPFVGPFLQMSRTEISTAGNVIFAADGALQIAGAAMAIVGLTWRTKALVPDGVAQVQLAPVRIGQGGTGVGLSGMF